MALCQILMPPESLQSRQERRLLNPLPIRLPDWLSFDTATSTFTGTPASSDDSLTISISAADALGSTSSSFDLNVRDVQKISATQDPINYQGGQAFSFPLIFSSTDDESSTGLAFQLHYDSSLFSF